MSELFDVELEQICPYGSDEQRDKETLLELCKNSIIDYDEKLIKRAFDLCIMAHRNVKRASGDPYYTHPLKVAISLINEFGYADNDVIAAALLHDVVEDSPDYSLEYIEDQFGSSIAKLVNGVTKIKGSFTQKLDKAATYAKLFQALIEDDRVMLVKLADRLDNMRTLSWLTPVKQHIIADETLNFYIPFAQRLGLIKIKRALEVLSFYFKDPKAYEQIRSELDIKRKELTQYITKFYSTITENLNSNGIDHYITIEHKHPYEIYRIAQEKHIDVSKVDDFFSVVVILKSNDFSECYKAYGIIANLFGPVDSLIDYISRPKINFYRALHSTHFGPNKRLIDVIIRTEEMDNIADRGIAAVYDLNQRRSHTPEDKVAHKFNEEDSVLWVKWMNAIIADGDEDAIQKIWGSIRMNQYEKEIIVFDSKSDYRLPKGACPIDLAFAVSDNTGLHCISCKVNGEIKPLNYELKNLDRVEIITSDKCFPLEEWQNFVITHKAVAKLYFYFKETKEQPVKTIEKTENKPVVISYHIVGEDRLHFLQDITEAVGQANISRINLSLNNNAVFEGTFMLIVPNENYSNEVYTKLLNIKGIKTVETVQDEDFDN